MPEVQLKLPMLDGEPLLPSVTKNAQGEPRFHVPLLKALLNYDGGMRYLITYELMHGGYEASSRQFFDEHLAPGDVFIDVGAHWGVFSFSAATRHPGQISVIAVEPHPVNLTQLLKGVRINKLISSITVIAAAAGNEHGTAHLRHASTMGHSLDAATPGRDDVPVLHVPMVPLDDVLDRFPELSERRLLLKIDVEGFEYEVLSGARRLMESGRVAVVMWEKGDSYAAEPGRTKMFKLLAEFARLGYRNVRFPSSEFVGPLVPFAPTPEVGNVFALSPTFEHKRVYELPFAPRPPFSNLFATPSDPARRAETARLLIDARTSDGARWADPRELVAGAQERAIAAAGHITAGSRVLDLGAGGMALAKCLPEGCQYTPADLLRRSIDCQVIDLNQEQFPSGRFDCIALLEVLEYIHDPAWLLRRCREAAPRLICTYHIRGEERFEERRQQGWFNDFDLAALTELISQAGWRIDSQSAVGAASLLACSHEGPGQDASSGPQVSSSS